MQSLLSNWIFTILFVVIAVSIGVGLAEWIRRAIPAEVLKQRNELTGAIHIAISTMYAILLSFILAGVWGQWSALEEAVNTEANTLLELDRSTTHLPEPIRMNIREKITSYSRFVVDTVWPELADNRPVINPHYTALWDAVGGVPDSTAIERDWRQHADEKLQIIDNARDHRLFYAKSNVPYLLWIFLIVGALITVMSTVFFDVEHRFVHVVLVGSLTMIIVLVLYMILELDHPFSGLARVSQDVFRNVIDQLKS